MTNVLITGIGTLLGARLAQRMSALPQTRVIGLGRRMPIAPVGDAAVLTATLNGTQLAELIAAEQVTTVIHLEFAGEEQPVHSREAAVQQNVLGSMELLGACAAQGVRRLVVRSSSLVYGALPDHPAFVTEDRPPQRPRQAGLLRDYVELETFIGEFLRRQPNLQITVLRCAPLIGGGVWSPLARYLAQPEPGVLFGFDPRIQVLHLDDAVEAFLLAATAAATGIFNVAGDGPVGLIQAIRLAGRQPRAVTDMLTGFAALFGRSHVSLKHWPYDLEFLRYNCVVDTRRAQRELGWAPQHPAAAALRELGAGWQEYNERAQSEAALQAFLARKEEA